MNKNKLLAALKELHHAAGQLAINDSRYRNVQLEISKATAHLDGTLAMQMRNAALKGGALLSTSEAQPGATFTPAAFGTTPPPPLRPGLGTRVIKKVAPPVEAAVEPEEDDNEDGDNPDNQEQADLQRQLDAHTNSGNLSTVYSEGDLLVQWANMSVEDMKTAYNKEQLVALCEQLGIEPLSTWNKAQLAGALRNLALQKGNA